MPEKSEFLPFNFAVHGMLEILPNSNNDGFHINFGSTASGSSSQHHGGNKNILEALPNDGGYRINLGALHSQGDDSDDDSAPTRATGFGGGRGGGHGGGSGHANVTGIIAIRNLEGQYLKVRSDGGLDWTSSVLDRYAKFEVKHIEDGKIFLLGANGKYVNHFYAQVLCQGPSGGWPLVVGYVDHRLVSFECDGEYLSCVSNGDGSLAVAKDVNFTSKFTIENFHVGHEC